MDNLFFPGDPVAINNNVASYCPYTKIENQFYNTPVPTAKDKNGYSSKTICVPNLNSRYPIGGFGQNKCENNISHHINIDLKSSCYSDNACNKPLNNCYDPYSSN